MTSDLNYSIPPAIQRIAQSFRLAGWVSFWIQAVLGVVCSVILLFASAITTARSAVTTSPTGVTTTQNLNPGTSAGLFLAVLGLLAVYVGAYWAFRYTRLARKLRTSNNDLRPKPKDAAQAIRLGITISLVGMFLTLMGAEAIVGALVGKAFSAQAAGFLDPRLVTQYIQPLDIFVVQATTNILLAHFAGISASLWLARTVNRQ
jgi:Protein of unknown function (DUF3611)